MMIIFEIMSVNMKFCGFLLTLISVIALSKLYDLKDPRLSQVQVKGDLIPNTDGRIMTRSRAKTSMYSLSTFGGP